MIIKSPILITMKLHHNLNFRDFFLFQKKAAIFFGYVLYEDL